MPAASIFVLPVINDIFLLVSLFSTKSTETIFAPVTTTFVADITESFVEFDTTFISLPLTIALAILATVSELLL